MPEQDYLGQQLTGDPDTSVQTATILADSELAGTVTRAVYVDGVIVAGSEFFASVIRNFTGGQDYLGQGLTGSPDLTVTAGDILAAAVLTGAIARTIQATGTIIASAQFAATAGRLTLPIPTSGMSISVSRRAVQRSFS